MDSSSQQYLDQILLNDLIAVEVGRKNGRQACYFSAAHPQQSRAVLNSHSTRYGSEILSTKHSIVLLFISETFHQNVLQESSDKIKRSCLKHHQTDCMTKINNRKGSIPPGVVLFSFCNLQTQMRKELLQCQEKDMEVDEHTAELYSKHGNNDIAELVVNDETAQCEKCQEHHAKVKSFCTCGSILQELSSEKTKTLKETAAQVMVCFSHPCSAKTRERSEEAALLQTTLPCGTSGLRFEVGWARPA